MIYGLTSKAGDKVASNFNMCGLVLRTAEGLGREEGGVCFEEKFVFWGDFSKMLKVLRIGVCDVAGKTDVKTKGENLLEELGRAGKTVENALYWWLVFDLKFLV